MLWCIQPVDWKSLGCPDYPRIIKRPADLSSVKNNLQQKKYPSANEAVAEIRLVWSNAMTYNAAGSQIHTWAKLMKAEFEKRFAPIASKFAAHLGGTGTQSSLGICN